MLSKNLDRLNYCFQWLPISKNPKVWWNQVQVKANKEWSRERANMAVPWLNLHLWKLKGFFKAGKSQIFHPKFCSCIMLENQKSWNQWLEIVLKIELCLINFQWQNYFTSSSRLQSKNIYVFSFSSPFSGPIPSFYSYSSYSSQRGHPEIYIWLSASSNFFIVFKLCTISKKLL